MIFLKNIFLLKIIFYKNKQDKLGKKGKNTAYRIFEAVHFTLTKRIFAAWERWRCLCLLDENLSLSLSLLWRVISAMAAAKSHGDLISPLSFSLSWPTHTWNPYPLAKLLLPIINSKPLSQMRESQLSLCPNHLPRGGQPLAGKMNNLWSSGSTAHRLASWLWWWKWS